VSWWQGLVLGLVQGLTEFLPISSSGHLVLAEALVGFQPPGVFVEVALHVATLLAVFVVYWRRILELAQGAIGREAGAWRYLGLLALATLPAAVLGVAFKDFFESTFHSLTRVGVEFLITGLILWSTRRPQHRARAQVPSPATAVGIGFAQAAAIFPAISRSGSTVAVGIWAGVDPVAAAEFSFLMSIPVIAGAALLEVPGLASGAGAVGAGPLLLGFVASMASGIFAIRWLLAMLRRRTFYQWAPYCWVVGILTIAWGLWRA
jgi:undecaprenyl-diphosphatase